jgi:hypothetical protein
MRKLRLDGTKVLLLLISVSILLFCLGRHKSQASSSSKTLLKTTSSHTPNIPTTAADRNLETSKSFKMSSTDSSSDDSSSTNVFALKKKRDGCTGMFWRKDPTNQVTLENNNNWPRDGAILKGRVLFHEGSSWLQATHVKNINDKDWIKAPKGAHMPMEYDNHYYLEPLQDMR